MSRFPYPLGIGLISDWAVRAAVPSSGQLGQLIEKLMEKQGAAGTELQLNILLAICGDQDVAAGQVLSELYPQASLHLILPVERGLMAQVLSATAAEAFEAILLRADQVWTSGQPKPNDLAPEQWPQFLERGRFSAGRFLVNYCDYVLFNSAANHYKDGGFDELLVLARAKQCPGLLLDGRGNSVELPGETMAQRFMDSMAKLEDSITAEPVVTHYMLDELQGSLSAELPQATLEAFKQQVLPVFIAAEDQAAQYQNLYNNAGMWAFGCSFLAAALVAVAVTFFHAAPVFFVMEFIMLMVGLGLIYRAEKRRSRHNWRSLRHLAEHIRTFMYMSVAGAEQPQHYAFRRSSGGGEADWVSIIMQQLSAVTPLPRWPKNRLQDLVAFVRGKWLDGQIKYHQNKLKDTKARAKRMERTSQLLFAAATIFALAHAAVPVAWQAFHHHLAAHWLTLLALILPVAGGALGATLSHRDYKRIALHSEKTALQLRQFAEKFNPLTMGEFYREVQRLADIMTDESEQWVSHIAARRLHPEP